MNLKKIFVVLVAMLMCGMALTVTAAAEDESAWDEIKEAASEAAETVKDKAPDVIGAAKEKGSELVDKAKKKAPAVIESAKEKGSELVDKAKEKAPEVAEKAKEGVKKAQETTSNFLQAQEDQFWGWFDARVNPNQDEAPEADTTPESEAANDVLEDVKNQPPYYYTPEADTETVADEPEANAPAEQTPEAESTVPAEVPSEPETANPSDKMDATAEADDGGWHIETEALVAILLIVLVAVILGAVNVVVKVISI